MQYVMFVCSDGVPSEEKTRVMPEAIVSWLDRVTAGGTRVTGHALAAPDSAATVTVRGGETTVMDGPFAETKEHIAGFDVLDCADLDEALQIAAAHPMSWFHQLELRPLVPRAPDAPAWADPARLTAEPPAGRTRYMLLLCDGSRDDEAEQAERLRDGTAWADRLAAAGVLSYAWPLFGPEVATTVRVRSGESVLADGPFAETKEFVGGIGVIDCATREEAVAVAAEHPLARHHRVEVRPFAVYPRGDEIPA